MCWFVAKMFIQGLKTTTPGYNSMQTKSKMAFSVDLFQMYIQYLYVVYNWQETSQLGTLIEFSRCAVTDLCIRDIVQEFQMIFMLTWCYSNISFNSSGNVKQLFCFFIFLLIIKTTYVICKTFLGLIWAEIPHDSYHDFGHTAHS